MSDLGDRRAQKKAQTRELVRATAHRLFAARGFDQVTIADVAREAEVAVQTVFNHFATKEDLFFDGRAPWVEGLAAAVLERPDGVSPLTALRAQLLELTTTQIGALATPEERCFRDTVDASETLRAYERTLVFTAERRLAVALLTAWRNSDAAPPNPEVSAPLTAAIWLGAVRVLIVENRLRVKEGVDAGEVAATVEQLGDRLLSHLQAGAQIFDGLLSATASSKDLAEDRRAG
ncbi:TetR/AcrR family transcriptional regulator [Blastococcus sp. SYSU D01042]